MPRSCCVFSCSNNTQNRPDLGFYILPHEKSRRKAWLKAINRAHVDEEGVSSKTKTWSPKTRYHYVCSEHFISGKKKNTSNDPDYTPSIFPNQHGKSLTVSGYERHLRRQKKLKEEGSSSSSINLSQQFESASAVVVSPDVEMGSPEVEMASPDLEMVSPVQSPDFSLQSPISISERESIYEEMDNLRSECDSLKTIVELQSKNAPFKFKHLQEDKERCFMLTGLPYDLFSVLVEHLCRGQPESSRQKLTNEDQLLLTLVKLKHNMNFEMLAYLSNISKTTAVDNFWKWMDILYVNLKFMIRMQDRDHIFATIPTAFKKKFPRLTSIIDCFEIFIESPSCLLARAKCYSHYKKHCTIKFMISCTPLGAVNFLSRCWGGRASDICIVKESGFHMGKYHMPGDQILADRGFTLIDEFAAGSGSELIIPAFTKGKSQLTPSEIESTRKIASVRIHIERIIGLIKNRYTILKGILPYRTVKSLRDEAIHESLSNCDKIVTVCSALINMNISIVRK